MTVIIIEDDEWSKLTLENLLKIYFPYVEVLGAVSNIKEGVDLINVLNPDFILADIQLGNETIFNLINQLENTFERNIILTTSHHNFALEAISKEVVDYILKPVTIESLTLAINKLKKRQTVIEANNKLLLTNKTENRMLGIASVNKIEVINIDAIIYIQADGRYTHFHMLDGSKKTASKNLGEYDKILPKEDFLRVHHSYIVNMGYVKSIQKTDGYFVELYKSKNVIPIAKRKQDSVTKFLKIKV
ncbi:MAG: LytTR family DNA-binding domain-containing protein [Cellulophaga sp.]|nr:LytTR family DNA-binding domain-containing protein [Cellulophaga sp.]